MVHEKTIRFLIFHGRIKTSMITPKKNECPGLSITALFGSIGLILSVLKFGDDESVGSCGKPSWIGMLPT